MRTVVIPGLVLENEWIPPLRFTNSTKSMLTRVILENKDVLFPDYYLVEFDLLLGKPDEDQVAADFAMVDKNCRSWCLMYVFPSRSVILSEVKHRIETTRNNDFGVREARALKKNIADLTQGQLNTLITWEVPELIIVTDDPHHGWHGSDEELPETNLNVLVMEAFSSVDRRAIRVDGMYPTVQSQDIVANARPHAIVPNALELDRPLPSPYDTLEQITLICGESASQWKPAKLNNEVRLLVSERHGLPKSANFKIARQADGTLLIQPFREE
jgi:hypothetical protein